MKVDPIRLARQELMFNRWRVGKEVNGIVKPAIAILTAVTGFGKTYILVLAIRYMNQKYPDRTAIVIVPTTKLRDDWTSETGHLKTFSLINTQVFVVNTFVKYKSWNCDLLGLDECHRYSNEDAQYFSTILTITKYRFLLGMSATLSKKQEEFFLKFGIPVVDTVDDIEAQKYGYVAPSIVYNLGIKLTDEDQKFSEDIDRKFKGYFSKFGHEFDWVKACNGKKGFPVSIRLRNGTYIGKHTPREWIEILGRAKGYDGTPQHPYSPENISRNAAQCMFTIRERKNKWHSAPQKLIVAEQIIRKFPVQTITFCETADFADRLVDRLPGIALAYHSKLKTIAAKGNEIIESENREETADLKDQGYKIISKTKRKAHALEHFESKKSPIRVLSTVRAMDEGVDIPSIELVLMLAYSSVARQDIQRKGRGARIDYENLNKRTLVINLYMMGTQEEKWLKEKQKGGKSVIWVESIDQISPSRIISLGLNNGSKESTINQSDIVPRTSGINSESELTRPVTN